MHLLISQWSVGLNLIHLILEDHFLVMQMLLVVVALALQIILLVKHTLNQSQDLVDLVSDY